MAVGTGRTGWHYRRVAFDAALKDCPKIALDFCAHVSVYDDFADVFFANLP